MNKTVHAVGPNGFHAFSTGRHGSIVRGIKPDHLGIKFLSKGSHTAFKARVVVGEDQFGTFGVRHAGNAVRNGALGGTPVMTNRLLLSIGIFKVLLPSGFLFRGAL